MKLNIVPARTGLTWMRLGVKTFLRQPLALAGLFFLYIAAGALLSLVPLVGPVLALGIVPAATLGLMAATQEADKGRFPMPTVLVSAFRAGRQRLRAMVILGALYAAACLAVMAITQMVVEVPRSPEASGTAAMMTPEYRLSMLLAMTLYLPVSLMFWHAPALVHWHGISPAKSLFFSTVACLRNWRALTLFGLAWLALLIAASTSMVLLTVGTGSPQLAGAALMPLALIFTAMFSTSIYFTFRDSFVATPEGGPGEAVEEPS
ncbi:BPSS1780 family membrane protein [Ramlibacter sp.]|uniref:BPSS1780 family membrane protein n=1 Tax=Ramlibacter sp. TaxID=1917967 RepID=UPI002B59A459|nr:BPSS1780 family membrane protein [Ramlibacter sp.]HWI81792.1 BPSS1780 family membrane protein [Ramlibacter sp.]